VTFRAELRPTDGAAVRRLVADANVFSPTEIGWAVELVDETLKRGPNRAGRSPPRPSS
jgi:hypothetical protein